MSRGERALGAVVLAIEGRAFDLPDSLFNLQFQVRRARLVSAEAELEGVFQMIEAEAIRTPLVGSIQKRALGRGFGHEAFPTRSAAESSALSWSWREARTHQRGLSDGA